VIVTGGTGGEVTIRDAETLGLESGPFHGHQTYADAVAVAQRGGRPVVLSGSRDGTMRIWMPPGRGELAAASSAHKDAVWSLGLTPSSIVSNSWDRTIRTWDAESLEPFGDPIKGFSGAIAVDEDNGAARVAVAGRDGLAVWSLETRRQIARTTGNYEAVAYAARAGRRVVLAGGSDGTLSALTAETLEPVGDPVLTSGSPASSMGVRALAVFSHDGRNHVVSSGTSGAIELWDVESMTRLGPPMRGHESVVYNIAVATIGGRRVAASASFDQTVRLWDLDRREAFGEPLTGHQYAVQGVCFGRWRGRDVLFSGGMDSRLRIWRVDTGELLVVIPLDSWIYALQARGPLVYAGCANGLAAIELR
jgi:WD40 repeat protein